MADEPEKDAELQVIIGLMMSLASVVSTLADSNAIDRNALRKRLETDLEYMKKAHGKTGMDVVEHMISMLEKKKNG